jgi:transcriptional regulator with XRE-family HTH domain
VLRITVIRYETDQSDPSWSAVRKLADALGKTPDDFLPGD